MSLPCKTLPKRVKLAGKVQETMQTFMDIKQILEILPHRFPMVLVDRIIDCEPGKRCRGLKNVTMNEAFFQGHYPGEPIMPGVLIVEAMAQSGAVILLSDTQYHGKIPVIGSIDDVRFKRQVVPGDQLITEVELLWIRRGVGKIRATASVDDELAAQMEMTFMLLPNGEEKEE